MTRLNCMPGTAWGILLLSSSLGLQAQVITSFSPRYGSTGDIVDIYGSGFQTGTIEVQFWNGIPVTMGSIPADGHIQVTSVPSGISTGPLRVRRNGGAWNYSPDIFTKVAPGPFIQSVTNNYGALNDPIQIYGVHFVSGSVVKFGGVTAASIPNGNGTQITAYVPSVSPGNVILTVTASGMTYTNSQLFTVVGAGPYIASFSPKAGSGTQPVTLKGLHFTGVNQVKFNGVSASFDPVVDDKQMTAYAPVGVTTGPIGVTTSQGTHTTSTLFYGQIALTGFSPPSGPTGSQVVINGTNFTDALSVKFGGFNGVSALFNVTDNSQITVTVPDNAPTGPIAVAAPANSLEFTTGDFVVTPTISGFTPSKGVPGTTVQINGTRLVDNAGGKPTVKFNNVNASSITSWGAQQVQAVAPASSSGFITLTTADGTSTSSERFYYPPRISNFSPNAEPPGTLVTINGQSLIDASSVLFNGIPSTNFTVLNNTNIQAEVPAAVTTGPITVTTPGGTTNSSQLYYAVPVISAFAPSSGGPGTSVSVFGTSFEGTTSVKFNGVNASFVVNNNNQITATVPGTALTGPISVTAPAGTATSAEDFVVPQVSDLRVNTFTNEPNPVPAGADLELTIVVANYGPNAAADVTASVTLASGQVVQSATFPAGATVDTNGNPVVFNIGTVTGTPAIPGYAEVTLVVASQLLGPATNTVTLASSTFDPDTGNNTATRVTTVQPLAELNIEQLGSNQVRVAWPASLTGYILQSTLALTNNAVWSTNATMPVTEGDEKVVTEPSTGAAKFYRLKN